MVLSVIVMESDIPGDLTAAEYRALLAKTKQHRPVRDALRRLIWRRRHD